MAYNPYNAAKQITDNKQKWANATAKGEDASAYESAAKQYYDELRGAGRDDVADKLQKSDAVQAAEYLRQLSPSYDATPEGLQGKSDDVYKTGKDYGADISKSYDTVYNNNINVDPTQTGYGKSVMASYGAAADKAYSTALGSGANDNGGNVDSYAAANANRQKAAMLSQGHGDILNYYNAIAGRATDWAGGKASALSGNLAQLQANVDADRADRQAVEQTELQKYLGDLGYKSQIAGYESNEQINADNNATQKYGYDVNERMNTANNEVQKYGIDANERMNTENNNTQKYVADKNYNGVVYKANASAKSASNGTDAGKNFALTYKDIIASAEKNSQRYNEATEKYEVDTAKMDAYIQNILNDTSYKQSEREKLAQTYSEYKGTYLNVPTASTVQTGKTVKTGVQYTQQPKTANDKYSQLLRRLSNQAGSDKKYELVLAWMSNGTVDSVTAQALLEDAGVNVADLTE